LVDLFEEVEEELRSDRYRNLFRNLAPWVTGFFALVLVGYLGFWGYKFYQDRNLAAAGAAYQKGVDAIGQNDYAGAAADFQAAAKAGSPGYKTLALIQLGGLRQAAGKSEEAAKLYDQAAASAPNQIFGDLARLRAAQVLLDTAPYPQLEARLKPLTDTKRPYWLYAKEALAFAKLMAGKAQAARADFQVLGISLGAPDDMRQRSQIALQLIDSGETPSAIAAVKLAATLPPPAPMSVPAPQGPQGQGAAPTSSAGAVQ
jgi:hypothetical protein